MSLNTKLIKIPVKKIIETNAYQNEIPLIEIENLKNNIIKNGLINPIIVKRNLGKYLLISGKKRLEAVKLAGNEDISAIILECNTLEAILLSLAECFSNKNDFIKQSVLIDFIAQNYELTPAQIAEKIGVDVSEILDKLEFKKFTNKEIRMIIDGNISENQAKLAVNFSGELRLKFIYYMVYKKLNYEQSKILFDKIKENSIKTNKIPKNKISDNRIILNTIKNSVKTMKKFGIDAVVDTSETENYTEYIVKIPKNPPKLSLIS